MTEARDRTGILLVQRVLTKYRHVERSDNEVETSPTDNARNKIHNSK